MADPLFLIFGVVLCTLCQVYADYDCLCNYRVETPMYGKQDTNASPVGYLYEFDCKPSVQPTNEQDSWIAIMNEHMIAYIEKGDGLANQVCQGSIPSDDKLISASTTSTTPTTTFTTTTKPTTTTGSTTPTTTFTTTTKPTSTTTSTTHTTTLTTTPTTTTKPTTRNPPTTQTSSTTKLTTSITTSQTTITSSTTRAPKTKAPKTTRPTTTITTTNMTEKQTSHGNLQKCPGALTRSVNAKWLRQYNSHCYEIVRQWKDWYDAELDCGERIGHRGELLEIYTADIQQYIMSFLTEAQYNHSIWIGLQDIDREEHFAWDSGRSLTYTNWNPNRKGNHLPHGKEDCVFMQSDGRWEDSLCSKIDIGKRFLMNPHNVNTRRPYICQYPTHNLHHGK